MNKIILNDGYQWLEIDEKDIINNFIKCEWELIMPNIEKYKKEVTLDNIEKLQIIADSQHNEDFYIYFEIILKNGDIWHVNPDNEKAQKWLEVNNLIE